MTSSDIAIRVEGLSKSFLLPHEKINSLREGLTTMFAAKTVEKFTVLDNISFDVKRGEFFGIIGRNGSGKSTLLKLLADIYRPDKGTVSVIGKLSPFLELGVGFNPELSGRENVFLNGIVLGLSHKQVEERYDKIVSFSGLGKFMDAKLKNFSSGMQVRLAFSVAIQASAEVFLIDEVLAVGDAEFQAKCFSTFKRMKRQGKTILFVSHDLRTIQEFCDRVMVLEKSCVTLIGKPEEAIHLYIKSNLKSAEVEDDEAKSAQKSKKKLRIESVKFLDFQSKPCKLFKTGDSLAVRIYYDAKETVKEPVFGIEFRRSDRFYVSGPNTKTSKFYELDQIKGRGYIDYKINSLPLLGGKYFVTIHATNGSLSTHFDLAENCGWFEVAPTELNQDGLIKFESSWQLSNSIRSTDGGE